MFNNTSSSSNAFVADQTNLSHCLTLRSFTNNRSLEMIPFTFECFYFKLHSDFNFRILAMLFCVIIAFEVAVNSIVLVSVLIEKNRKRIDICFMSNACSDLIMGLVIMPFTAIYTLFGYFPSGTYTCFVWNILDFTVGTVSMLHIMYISYDRYLSVSKPLRYSTKSTDKFSMTGIPTYLVLAFIWFFSMCLWVPVILYLKTSNPTGNYLNSTTYGSDEIQLTDCSILATPTIIIPHTIIVYYLPMCLIFVFYSKTIHIVNQKVKKRRSSTISLKNFNFIPQNASEVPSKEIEDEEDVERDKITNFNSLLNSQPHVRKMDINKSTLLQIKDLAVPCEGNPLLQSDQTLDDIDMINMKTDNDAPTSGHASETSNDNTNHDQDDRRHSLKRERRCSSLITLPNTNNNPHILIEDVSAQLSNSTSGVGNSPKTIIENDNASLNIIFNNDSRKSSIENKIGILKKNVSSSLEPTKKLSFSGSFQELQTAARIHSSRLLSVIKASPEAETGENTSLGSLGRRRISFCSLTAASTRVMSISTREKNVTYKLGFIMATFLICWLPFSILWPLSSVCAECINQNLYLFSFWLAYANSFFTPIILLYNNEKYRQALTVFKGCFQSDTKRGLYFPADDRNSFFTAREVKRL